MTEELFRVDNRPQACTACVEYIDADSPCDGTHVATKHEIGAVVMTKIVRSAEARRVTPGRAG